MQDLCATYDAARLVALQVSDEVPADRERLVRAAFAGALPANVPSSGYPQFWSNCAQSCMFAIKALIKMIGMLLV